MDLSRGTLKTIANSHTLSTFFPIVIIRGTEVRSHSGSSTSSSPGSRFFNFCLYGNLFAVNSLLNIDGIKTKDVFLFEFFFLFRVSFFARVAFEVIINDAGKGCISYCCCDLFSALNTSIFFAVDEFSEAPSTEPMVARLDCDRNGHDFVAKRASDLIFDGLSKLARCCLFLLSFFVFLLSLFVFLLSPFVFLFSFLFALFFFLLPFLLFLLYLFYLFFLLLLLGREELEPKTNRFLYWYFAGC